MEFKILCKGNFNQGSDFFPLAARGKLCFYLLDVFIEKTLTLDIHVIDSTKQYLHDVMKRGDEMAEVVQMKHAF